MGDIHYKTHRSLGSLLASIFVMLGGFLSCVAVIVAFSHEPRTLVVIVTVGFGGLLLMLWRMWDRPASSARERFLWVFSRRARPKPVDYEPKLIRSQPTHYGTNHPPTVDEVRDLKDTVRTWVPSGVAPRPRKSRR